MLRLRLEERPRRSGMPSGIAITRRLPVQLGANWVQNVVLSDG
jgi:hypothetical protein